MRFFNQLSTKQHRKQYAVIGLGRFGRSVAQTMQEQGYDLLCTDVDGTRVEQMLRSGLATHVVQLDSTQPEALKAAGLFEMDGVIVAIGNYIEASVITTLNLKEGGVSEVVAKASSEIHVKLLKKVGADRVVFPEDEMGRQLARSLTCPGILERFDLDEHHGIVEVEVPEQFVNQTIAELQLRKRYGLNVIALSHEGKFVANPTAQMRLVRGGVMVVIGRNEDIDRWPG
jgi:trk system potassium uptake protein